MIEYDDEHNNTEGWVTHFPRTFFVQEQVRDAVDRADRYNWRMGVKKKQRMILKKIPQVKENDEQQLLILLPH